MSNMEKHPSHLSHSEDTSSSGSKFVINCKAITSESPTTSGWLDHIAALQIIPDHKALRMPHKKILEGIFENRRRVVVKVANDTQTLHNEWDIYQQLASLKIPGILKYYCYFTCNDTLTRIITDQHTVCNGPGNNTQVLVMDYVNAPSLKNYDWRTTTIDAMRSCIKQVILTAIEGFLACQFIHGDLHLDNVLVKQTKKAMIHYPLTDVILPVNGLCTKLMDLEDSSVGKKNVLQLCKELKYFVNKMIGDFAHILDIHDIQKIHLLLRDWVEDKSITEAHQLLQILPMIDSIKFLQRGGRPPTPKKRASCIGKKGRANFTSAVLDI